MELNDPLVKKLYEAAKATRENAHARYSKYKVGCAILGENDQIITGANVENAVNGASVCAEITAVSYFISSGLKKVRAVIAVTQSDPPGPPCGWCRQFISEFAPLDTPIFYGNIQGTIHKTTLSELLPHAYTPDHMTKFSQ